LVEGETSKADDDKSKQITLLLTLPSDISTFTVRLRASFKNGKELKSMPSEWEGIKGQQGFHNYEFNFPLK